MRLSIAIPTFGREQPLIDTIKCLLIQEPPADEILVVDQTQVHEPGVRDQLDAWNMAGTIRWVRLPVPGITEAMNRGLLEARCPAVLFLDDDIIPQSGLIGAHIRALEDDATVWAVAGQVLQPGQEPVNVARSPSGVGLTADLEFSFNGMEPAWVTNVMAGNLCVRREQALRSGGFDERLAPPVAFRFETEFARRLIAAGGRILFEPAASLRHLRVPTGGTRSQGGHLTSGSPVHGMGDYYYALRWGRGWDCFRYIVRRPFREVRTRFHLSHPWWIPVKFVGELRALAKAVGVWRKGPRLLGATETGGAADSPSVRTERRPLFLYSARKQEGNLGDCVINRELLRLLRDRGEVRALVSGVNEHFLSEIGLSGSERCTVFGLAGSAVRARLGRRPMSVVLTPGGENDRMHFRRWFNIREALFWLGLRVVGIRVIHVGFSLSPPTPARSRYERWLKPRRLKAVCAVRDSHSVGLLRAWGVNNPVKMPDFAFMTESCPGPLPRGIAQPYLVISLRFDEYGRYMDRLYRATDAMVEDAIRMGLSTMSLNWQVEEDKAACETLARRYAGRMTIVTQLEWLSELELYSIYRHAAWVFSNRLHVLLFTWIQGGLPVVMGDELFNQKVVSLFRDEGLEALMIPADDTGPGADAVVQQLGPLMKERDAWLVRLSRRRLECRQEIIEVFNRLIAKPML